MFQPAILVFRECKWTQGILWFQKLAFKQFELWPPWHQKKPLAISCGFPSDSHFQGLLLIHLRRMLLSLTNLMTICQNSGVLRLFASYKIKLAKKLHNMAPKSTVCLLRGLWVVLCFSNLNNEYLSHFEAVMLHSVTLFWTRDATTNDCLDNIVAIESSSTNGCISARSWLSLLCIYCIS